MAAGAVAAVFLGGYALDDIANTTAWRYGTWIAIAYIVSRGIAKAGSQRSYQPEPYDDRAETDFWGDANGNARRSNRDDAREEQVRESSSRDRERAEVPPDPPTSETI